MVQANVDQAGDDNHASSDLIFEVGVAVTAIVLAFLIGKPGWGVMILVGSVALLSLSFVGTRRDRLAKLLVGALSKYLGPEGSVRLTRWPRMGVAHPSRVRLRYAAGIRDGDPRWIQELTEIVSQRLQGTYQVVRHHPSKLFVDLALTGDEISETSDAELRARRILEDLIPSARVTAMKSDADGEVVQIDIKHEAGAKLVPSGYRARVERSVSSLLPGRWRAQWDMEADTVRLEQRPALPDSIWLPPLSIPDFDPMTNYDKVEVPLAVDEDGHQVTWRPALQPHLLLSGETGTGKTATEHAILAAFAQYGWPIWVADGKAIEFLGYRDWPNVQIVASTIPDQVAMIHRARELMQRRYDLILAGKATAEDFEPLLVFIDEYTDLRANLLDWYLGIKQKGDPKDPGLPDDVASLARKARTSRIHLILATQRVDARFTTGEMRDNFTMRLSVGRISPQSALMMWNNPAIGTSLPRNKRQRAVTYGHDGTPVEVQCYRAPDPKNTAPGTPEWDVLESLRPSETRQPRLLIVEPKPENDLDTGQAIAPSYQDYADATWVRAADHPELDPLVGESSREPSRGQALASAMSLLNLAGSERPSPSRSDDPRPSSGHDEAAARPALRLVDAPAAGPSAGEGIGGDGYGESETVAPDDLVVGDLVALDSDADLWATVCDEPLPDLDEEDVISVSWRSDDDEYGELLVPVDGSVTRRSPEGIPATVGSDGDW